MLLYCALHICCVLHPSYLDKLNSSDIIEGLSARKGKLCVAIAATYPLEPTIPFVDWVLKKSRGASWMQASHDLVYNNSAYSPVIHSKFAFILHAMDWNPFNSTHFYWFDAGIRSGSFGRTIM